MYLWRNKIVRLVFLRNHKKYNKVWLKDNHTTFFFFFNLLIYLFIIYVFFFFDAVVPIILFLKELSFHINFLWILIRFIIFNYTSPIIYTLRASVYIYEFWTTFIIICNRIYIQPTFHFLCIINMRFGSP